MLCERNGVIQQLRSHLDEFLQSRIYSKAEEDRTNRDNLTEAAIDTLDELLIKYQVAERKAQGGSPRAVEAPGTKTDRDVTSVLKSYVEINRDYDLMSEDAELADIFRSGRRGRNGGTK